MWKSKTVRLIEEQGRVIDYLRKENDKLSKRMDTIESRQGRVEHNLSGITTQQQYNDYVGYAYYYNLPKLSNILRRVVEFLGLEEVPPNQDGWGIRVKPKSRNSHNPAK
jgi:hypothetical protein